LYEKPTSKFGGIINISPKAIIKRKPRTKKGLPSRKVFKYCCQYFQIYISGIISRQLLLCYYLKEHFQVVGLATSDQKALLRGYTGTKQEIIAI
jgi:hypothetical protein